MLPQTQQPGPCLQSEGSVQLQPKLSLRFDEEVYQLLYSHNYFVCSAPARIIVHSLVTKQTTLIKVCTTDYVVVGFPPYVFSCLIGQFIYLYNEKALLDVHEIEKLKISKLNVKALCNFNKGYFMGGYNRSSLPGGRLTDRRAILYLEDLTHQHKNKALWEIGLPKSQSPVSILQMQNPYLMCYCEPFVYLINPFSKSIIISFQKQFLSISMIEGRYATGCANMLGVSMQDKNIISADVEKYPVFGVELNEYTTKARSICQSRSGLVYGCYQNEIFNFDLFRRQKRVLKSYPGQCSLLQILCTSKNVLVVMLKSAQDIEKSESTDANQRVSEMPHPFEPGQKGGNMEPSLSKGTEQGCKQKIYLQVYNVQQ